MSTAAATSGPAREPRPASSAPATKRDPRERSKRNSRAALRRRARERRPAPLAEADREPEAAVVARSTVAGHDDATTGGSWPARLEDADPVRWPVGEEGLADDPAPGDRAPEAAVVARPPVVAHHEVVVGGDRDRLRQVAAVPPRARLDEV